MTGFAADPPRLRAFARSTDSRAAAMQKLRATMDDIRVGRDAFGHIPMLGSSVYDAYDEHVTACEDAVSAAADALGAVGEGLRTVGDIYEEGDRQMGEDLAAFHQRLDSIASGGDR